MKKWWMGLTLVLAMAVWVWAKTPPDPAAALAPEASGEAARAAQAFLDSLAPEQQQRILFALDAPERTDWHFIPRARPGVPFKEMTPEQRQRSLALVRSALSDEGYRKATTITLLDQVLFEQSRNPIRDPALYFFTIYGQPSASRGFGTWAWRLEGHHLSLNFTLEGGELLSATPSFFGANPAEVREGPLKGTRALAAEEDLGRQLLGLMAGEQRKKVLMAVEAPDEIITGTDRKVNLGPPVGVPWSEMSDEQRSVLWELIEVYARRLRRELAEAELERIRAAGVEKIHFAWAGGSEPGQGHYYRVHGPSLVIEYDNTQNGANHIHTVWRDIERDFAADLLREHYLRAAHHHRAR
ncbi:MAG: DUF3500 domain-containing protein [Acidobacteria bacterium]|nr:DUF3500 domain-containing protein [Acidobacteriota bacterium]